MTPSVIHENKDYLIINKPAGLVVHSDGRTEEKTLVDWILEHYPEIEGVGEDMVARVGEKEVVLKRPGIVHRLDRETSGVMLVAKTQEAFDFLKSRFKDRSISKTYLGIVYGHPKENKGVVNAPMGRSQRDFRRYTAGRGVRGEAREAVTEYTVLERFQTSDDDRDKYSLIEFSPKTGRTHQIRVHAKYMNHPIVCDSSYGTKKFIYAEKSKICPLGLTRHALHAHALSFEDNNGERVTYSASVPEDFRYVLDIVAPKYPS